MAIKYVEDYRVKNDNSLSDTETIRNAVSNLEEGDILVFKTRKTYVLDEPVYLTQYYKTVDGVETVAYKTKRYLTIDGNGCTIRGSNSFLETYGHTGTNNKNALFYTSDDAKHGMEYCTIKNFKFKWAESTTEIVADRSVRNMGLGVVTSEGSIYFSNGIIENCTFEDFRVGLYQCGDNSIVRGCTFTTCYKGIYFDGSVHNVFENNHFFTTFDVGLHLGCSYDSTARNNKFYKCTSYSIYANGLHEKEFYDKSTDEYTDYLNKYKNTYPTRLTITDNKIFGRYADVVTDNKGNLINDKYVQDIGIGLQAVRNVIVTGNHIAGIGCDKRIENEATSKRYGYGFGFGIIVNGNNDYNYGAGVCFSKNVIISNNSIHDCYGGGIKVNHAAEITVTNNLIVNDSTKGIDSLKYGIQVKDNTHGVTVSDNALYYFGDGKCVVVPSDNEIIDYQGNAVVEEEFVLDSYTINGQILTDTEYSAPYLILPQTVFSNGEKFRAKIPSNYETPTNLKIKMKYDENIYDVFVLNPDNSNDTSTIPNIPTDKKNSYIWLIYKKIGNNYVFFFDKYVD